MPGPVIPSGIGGLGQGQSPGPAAPHGAMQVITRDPGQRFTADLRGSLGHCDTIGLRVYVAGSLTRNLTADYADIEGADPAICNAGTTLLGTSVPVVSMTLIPIRSPISTSVTGARGWWAGVIWAAWR